MNHPVIRDMSCRGFVVAVAHMLRPVCVLFVGFQDSTPAKLLEVLQTMQDRGNLNGSWTFGSCCFKNGMRNVYNKELRALVFSERLHPGKLTWNLKMMVWKLMFLFQGSILRFHVNLPGVSISITEWISFV